MRTSSLPACLAGLVLWASPADAQTTNLARNRPVTVSSIEAAGLGGPKAVDGSRATRWASLEGSDPQWIAVDLGASVSLTRVLLRWEAAYASAYRIESSPDGNAWTTVFSTTTGNGGVDDVALSGLGRHVRVFGTTRATPYGYSLWELEVYGSPAQPPGVPAGLAALAVSSTRIDVSWSAVAGATGYDLEVDGATLANVVSPYAHVGLVAGGAHAYRVRAKNAFGVGAWSASVSATTPGAGCTTVPSTPAGLRATSVTSTSISLAWDASTAGPQCSVQYRLFRDGVVVTQSAATSHTLGGLTPGTAFTFTVAALDEFGLSAPSAPLSVSTGVGGTPVEINGQLHVCGTKLCNQFNLPIQLRGMSTHGLQWYSQCVSGASLDALAQDWQADVLRISLYVQEGGYESDPVGFTNRVHEIIDQVTARGLYALVDWHMLDPGDPHFNLERAKTYFTAIAQRHGQQPNVLYEIANEPNGVDWARIKSYAEQLIPVIRAIDPDAPVLIGTRGWSSLGVSDGANANEIVANPVSARNVMYTFHFYAASHGATYRNELARAADLLPIFVTEFGTQQATGDGANDFESAQAYLDLMRAKQISWVNWNFSDDFRSGAAFKPGTCPGGPFAGISRLKPAGVWVRERLFTPPDSFPMH